jgi:TonB family protein
LKSTRYIIFIIFLNVAVNYSQNGIIKTYYPDGTPRTEISYVNDVLDGSAILFYSNGNIQEEKNYSNGILSGIVREYYPSGLLKMEYSVKNGIKDGNQRIYYENGSLKEISIFSNGQRNKITSFEFDPNYIALPQDYKAGNRQQEILNNKNQDLICDADICPVPIGGLNSIYEHLIYPEHALLYGLESSVTLVATINEAGDVTNTEVIIHLGLGCDEAAQEAVKNTKFLPGQKNGKIVESHVTLTINFKIVDRSLVKNDLSNEPEIMKNVIENNDAEKQTKKFQNDTDSTKSKEKNLSQNDIIKKIAEIKCDNVDECPYPEAGIKSINKNLDIPFIAKRLKLKGEIEIKALIDKFGITHDTQIIKGIGYGCDEAVESALMRTKFTPAKKNGTDTEAWITVLFPFNYEE